MKKVLLALFMVLCLTNIASAWDEDFDFDTPAGTADAGQLDTFIQETKKGFAERLNQDHWFPEDNNAIDDLTAGYHRHVTLTFSQSDPSTYTGAGHVYTKYDSADVELFYQDDDGDALQLTKDDALNVTGAISVSDISISNNATIDNILSVGNTITANSDLYVNGSVYLDTDLTVDGALTASGYHRLIDAANYGTSASSSTTLFTSDMIIREGFVEIAGSSSQAITNLPFSSDSSYVVVISIEVGNTDTNSNVGYTINSGSQFTIYNKLSGTYYFHWVAIGT